MSIIPNINNQSIAILSDIEQWKEDIADAINTKGGSASADSSFSQLAEGIENLNDSFITYGVTTNGDKIDWLKFICTTDILDRSNLVEIDRDDIIKIYLQSAFENCINLKRIRLKNLKELAGGSIFRSCLSLENIDFENIKTITAGDVFRGCISLKELYLPNLISITAVNVFYGCPLRLINLPKCSILSINGIFADAQPINIILGKLTILVDSVWGVTARRFDGLRNITIGQDTDIDLTTFYRWIATNVISEGQSGIDELNSNLYNNLLTKLYDHSEDGQTRTLRLGWLDYVSEENIAYATAKGWTLTT